jgi:hypothetical protein
MVGAGEGHVHVGPLAAPGLEERQMRFIVCARSRDDGTMSLVSGQSFPNRREAVEAIVASDRIDALLGSDVFLVDLEAASPVALIPVGDAGSPLVRLGVEPAVDTEETPRVGSEGDEPAESAGVEDNDGDAVETARFGSLEIDIDSWTCEDCIYVLTCDRSGTTRPAECGSFQWRA